MAGVALDALGDPMRRRILDALRAGPTAVGDLARELPIGRPAVSKHLRVLRGAGLVEPTRRGTRHLYALAPEGLRDAQQWLVELWDVSLQSFADFMAAPRAGEPRPRQRREVGR
jgi:DNA-binding transcriptional ArsR family regulator